MAHSGYYTDSSSFENINEALAEVEADKLAAQAAEAGAVVAQAAAEDAATLASDTANSALTYATQAATSASNAANSETGAFEASGISQSAATTALGYKDAANVSKVAAELAETNAETAETNAAASAAAAAATLTNALTKANNLSDVQSTLTSRVNLGAVPLKGAPYCTAGGTANAVTLDPVYAPATPTGYSIGDQYRAKFSVTNTGATTVNVSGLGVKNCVTITGVALPAGYLRVDVETVLTYNGTSFVVDRQVEYGSNANGEFWRYADGLLHCEQSGIATDAVSNATGSVFRSSTISWTFPATFLSTPTSGSPHFLNIGYWSGSAAGGSTSLAMRAYSSISVAATSFNWSATGRWY